MAKQVDHNDYWYIQDNPISKVGIFPYLGKQISPKLEKEKIYNVLRPEKELFSEETIQSFKLVPLVDEHEMLGKEFTPAEEKGVHGVLGENIYGKDGLLFSDVKIFSEKLKDEINSGKKELSLGYRCDYDLKSGIYDGQRYDAVQRNIRGNHVALVQEGRMGSEVRVLDSKDTVYVCDIFDIKGAEHMERYDVEVCDFEESKVKRDDNGKFSSTGGSGGNSKGTEGWSQKTIERKKRQEKMLSRVGEYQDGQAYKKYISEHGDTPVNRENATKKDLSSLALWVKKAYGSKKAKSVYMQKAGQSKYNPYNRGFSERVFNFPSKDEKLESNKINGARGKDEAPEKETEMDKREVIQEIMAISAKPVSEFSGGDEEKVETIAKLAEKLAYNDSEREDKRELIDEIGGILKGKVDEELWRTVIGKAEKLAYNDDERGAEDAYRQSKDEDGWEKEKDKVRESMDKMPERILKMMAERESLYSKLTPVIGAFDHSLMTTEKIAKYACDKLDLKVSDKEALPTLKGFLSARKTEHTVSMDSFPATSIGESKDAAFEEFLKGAK